MNLKRWTSRITSVLIILFIIAAFYTVVSNRINKGKTTVFGSEIMVVLSGSMAPTFDTGSLVAVKPVVFSDIRVGDIVTFKDNDGRTVTHRVAEIKNDKLITKGDANDGRDGSPVTSDRIIGKVHFWLPYLGYLVEFVKSKAGLILFLVIPGVYLIVSQLWKIWKLLTREEEEEKDSLQSKA